MRTWSQKIYVRAGTRVGVLELEDGQGNCYTHLFDSDILEEVNRYSWVEKAKYAIGNLQRENVFLHRLSLNLKGQTSLKEEVDHIDRDTRNSRRYNLRITTRRGNGHNQSNHGEWGPGIILHNEKYYRVQIKFNNKRIFRPSFKTIEDAKICRDTYVDLGHKYDAGLIPLPTKEELKKISESIRIHHSPASMSLGPIWYHS